MINHDVALVSKNFVQVGLNVSSMRIPGEFARLAILHITKVEELAPA